MSSVEEFVLVNTRHSSHQNRIKHFEKKFV